MKNYLFIGENLKIMQDEKFQKIVSNVDTIYIDPPYNTGKHFSYNDKREVDQWLDFMKKRLIASYKILKDTGIIFISIDDNQYAYLKVLCDEIFGIKNFLGTFITMQSQRSNAKHINIIHEYIVCYAKNKKKAKTFSVKRTEIPEDKEMIEDIYKELGNSQKENRKKTLKKMIKYYCNERKISWLKNYSNIDENGRIFFAKDLSTPSEPRKVNIPEINLSLDPLKTRGWSSDKKFIELYKDKKLVYKNGRPYEKQLLEEAEDNAPSVLNFFSRQGGHDLEKLGLKDIFDTPKPVKLIKYLIKISTPKNGIVLDFFAGSGTTGQAVMELNKEENAKRRFILIQQYETVNPKTKAHKICRKINIKPVISEIALYRLMSYIRLNSVDEQIEVLRYQEDCDFE